MLGGEIYHRAIGRPWGPAADFIVTARLTQVPLGHPPAGPLQWPDHGPPARERSEPLAHSSSSRAGREYSGPPSVGRPPEPSVCRTLSDCLPRAAGLPARAPRALVLFRFGTVKKKYQGQPHTHTVEGPLQTIVVQKNVGLVLPTPFGNSRYTHDLELHHTANCRVLLGGEIYYRAIGRPWGPAADFMSSSTRSGALQSAGRGHWPQAARAARERSEPLAHSSSSQAGRLGEYSGPP
jgi:hypothetical protein